MAVAPAAARPASALADACTPPVVNQVACENTKPGAPPASWEIDGAGDRTIQGYATQMSVRPGDRIDFKIKSATSNYHIDVFRLGYYQGLGARLMAANIQPTGPATQPACQTFSDTGLIDCGNWSVSASWSVPTTAVSGVYIAYLRRNDTGGASQIIFVVRDDTSHSDIVVQTSDATWTAYNTYGGNSLYQCTVACPPGNPSTYKGAYKVSYNRPSTVAEDDGGRSALFSGGEYPMIRFLERSGYDVSYLSQVDVEQRGALLKNHKIYISSGHDEYVSANQRANIEAARDAGVNLAFFSGNELFWKTRYEPSQDGTNTAGRTLVSYKDTHFPSQQDPVAWTGTWRDGRFAAAADGVRPENALTGQSFTVNSGTSSITVGSQFKNMRLWRGTAAAALSAGQSLTLAPSSLGYEWDQDVDNGFRPAGLFHLSSTTVANVEVFSDYGSSTTTGTATHSLTMYRAPSGARVFGAGTVQWAWGLDDSNWAGNAVDVNMQQATVNLFADMGAQPATPIPGLMAAAPSTDATPPTSAISAPPASVADGAKVTINGTASDGGGGVVAGVEVSTDGGATWHPATGTTSWTYTWIAHGNPSTTILTRAVDDSGNLETPGPGATVAVTCPCSLWGDNVTPPTGDSGDPTPVEVGVKFRSDRYGTIDGIRFYKPATDTGTHTGSLWTSSGQRLAQVTFTGESASGWQTASFSAPVQILPDTVYVASYYAPNGHYAGTSDYLYRLPAPGPSGGSIADSAPLHALRNTGTSVSSTTNGVYSYSSTSTFPTSSYGASNYWVDVLFTPTPAPGAVSGVAAVEAGKTSANVTWNAPTTGGAPTSYTVTPYIGSTAQPAVTVAAPATSRTVTGLTTGTTYRFTVQAVNPNGAGPVSALSNAVTPTGPVVPTAPGNVVARPATRSALVSWDAPSSDGDSTITGYTVTPYAGGTAQSPVQVAAPATSTTITGLTNGTSYTFTVTATNGVGTGPASPASRAAVPQATVMDFATPAVADAGDSAPVELGMKFTADYDGTVTGVRFYKAAANTGTHTGSLWTASGTRLAQATFTNETATGWQSATFSSPVEVTAGTTYVVSYFAPLGHYSATGGGLGSGIDNGMLHALAGSSTPNGVYAYGATSTFPASSYGSANYGVDVLYAVPVPGQVTSVSAAAGGTTSAALTWSAPASGGPVTAYRITPYAGTVAQAPTTVPATTSARVSGLTTGTTYTFTVQALNANGGGPVSAPSNAVTPAGPVLPTEPRNVAARPATASAQVSWDAPASDGDSAITSYTVTPYAGTTAGTPVTVSGSKTSAVVSGLANGTSYTFKVKATNGVGTGPDSAASAAVVPDATIYDFATPSTLDGGDANSVELGVKFKADVDGSVTGVRFYKAAANTGTHTASLWTASGTRLAQATFAGESDSGWQAVRFATPVAITAGTTYVASYHAPNGHYSVTAGGLASGADNGLLHALANSATPNGVFAYGSTSAFPAGSYNAGDYGVDVLFHSAGAPGAATGVTATAGPGSATVSWTAPSSGGAPTSYRITPYIGSSAQPATTVTGSPPATSRTISGLTPGTAYTFTVTATNAAGAGPESAPSSAVTPPAAGAPGAPTGVTAVADTTSAMVSWTAPADDGGSAITGYTITPRIGGVAQTPTTVGSGTSARVAGLTNGTSYTFTVTAANSAGTGPASAASNAVAPLWSLLGLATPAIVDAGDASGVNLGVKFTADRTGSVTGVRFYKAAANTGTHVAGLWDGAGTLLRQATFAGESASGWQTVTFSSPYTVTAGATYVAGYFAPNGHYSVTGAAFASPFDNPPLHALADSTTPNGVYAYGSTPALPASSWNATNYWVDVLFQ